jgi:hypothetical protein
MCANGNIGVKWFLKLLQDNIWPYTFFYRLHQVHNSNFVILCGKNFITYIVLYQGKNKNMLTLDIDDQIIPLYSLPKTIGQDLVID